MKEVQESVKHLEDAMRIIDARRWQLDSVPHFPHTVLDRVELHINQQIHNAYAVYFMEHSL